MRIFGLKNCDTCRKALKTLQGAELIDVRDTPLDAVFLADRLAEFGSALINTRSTTWRGLAPEDQTRPPLELLAENPTLMKRPLIETNGRFHLGWTKDVQTELGVI